MIVLRQLVAQVALGRGLHRQEGSLTQAASGRGLGHVTGASNNLQLKVSSNGREVRNTQAQAQQVTALGALVNGSGAADTLAEIISGINFHSEFTLIIAIVTLNVILSDVVNNTACAAVTIPIVISIAQGLGLPVIPYLWIATVSYNLSFTLPTSIRSIPVGYGLDTRFMFRKGVVITVCMILLVSVMGWLFVRYWPAFTAL